MALGPIEQLVFVQILKISSGLLSQYHTMADRLFYLIFIPHIVLIIFIYVFADSAARMGGGIHMGMRTLIGLATYITIVFTGWYGTLLVPIFVNIWQMMVILGLVAFIGSRFLHPGRAAEMMALGKMAGEKITEKGKIRKKLEHDRDALRRMIREVNQMAVSTREGQQSKEMQIVQLKSRLAEIEHELNELA